VVAVAWWHPDVDDRNVRLARLDHAEQVSASPQRLATSKPAPNEQPGRGPRARAPRLSAIATRMASSLLARRHGPPPFRAPPRAVAGLEHRALDLFHLRVRHPGWF
jgi:hypothetical protein